VRLKFWQSRRKKEVQKRNNFGIIIYRKEVEKMAKKKATGRRSGLAKVTHEGVHEQPMTKTAQAKITANDFDTG
jgi:hypothetical protein